MLLESGEMSKGPAIAGVIVAVAITITAFVVAPWWVVYRMSDAAMLAAAILVHHLEGRASLSLIFNRGDGGAGASLTAGEATAIGLLLALAAAGKSTRA